MREIRNGGEQTEHARERRGTPKAAAQGQQHISRSVFLSGSRR